MFCDGTGSMVDLTVLNVEVDRICLVKTTAKTNAYIIVETHALAKLWRISNTFIN